MIWGRKGCFFLVFSAFFTANVTECNRKGRRAKEGRVLPPQYDIHKSEELPSDKQVTTFLHKGETKQFLYNSFVENSSLSITITACSSQVQWALLYKQNHHDRQLFKTISSDDPQTYHMQAKRGVYLLKMAAGQQSTFVHVYLSTEPGGSLALKTSPDKAMKLLRRQRRKRLTVRWTPSFVDPQGTDYCLVVSISRHYTSLCSAQGHQPAGVPPMANQPAISFGTVNTWEYKEDKFGSYTKDPLIACVGNHTHYALNDLKQNQTYYFDLFAINRQSNLTYLYASSSMLFDKRVKPTTLKEGKGSFVNLKKLDGKAVFKYKVPRKSSGSSLVLFVMPCGGAVNVEIMLNGKVVDSQRNVVGLGRMFVSRPTVGSRYYIRVLSANVEELRKTTGVEIYISSKPEMNLPLPNVPREPNVQEYPSLRKCDSVTIGWVPSPGQRVAYYCIIVKEGRLKEMEELRSVNQCGLESRLRKSADFYENYCLNIKHPKESVLVRKISRLKPGKNYIVQVTVTKPKGKALSYDLLQVQTKPVCER